MAVIKVFLVYRCGKDIQVENLHKAIECQYCDQRFQVCLDGQVRMIKYATRGACFMITLLLPAGKATVVGDMIHMINGQEWKFSCSSNVCVVPATTKQNIFVPTVECVGEVQITCFGVAIEIVVKDQFLWLGTKHGITEISNKEGSTKILASPFEIIMEKE